MPDQHDLPNIDLTGAEIDSFRLVARISGSRFAALYRVEHSGTAKSGLLHLFSLGMADDPAFAERFQRLCAAVQMQNHPGLPQIQTYGTCSHGYFFVVDTIDGQSISARMGQGRLARTEIINVMHDVSAALSALRGTGVSCIHLSPEHIFITADGRALVNPFNMLNLAAESPQLRLACAAESPYYLAPELLTGESDFSAAGVYSAGAILFEMIAATPPFVDSSVWKVWQKHAFAPPPNLQDFAPQIPDTVKSLVAEMLAKDPADRPADVRAAAATLQSVWQADDDETQPEQTGTVILPQVFSADEPSSARRTLPKRALVGVGVALMVLIIGGIWWLRRPIHSVAPPAAAIETPTRTATTIPSATIPPKKITDTPPAIAPAPTATTPTATVTPMPAPTPTETATATPLPTVTPNNADLLIALRGKILFKTNRNGQVEIFQMDADGANQAPLPAERAFLYNDAFRWEAFSPNHEQTLVVRGPGQFDIWRVDLTAGVEQRLTSHPAADYDPVWSPDNTRAAFVSERTGGGDLYLYDFGDNGMYRLTDDGASFDKHPSWSPDGKWLAFGSNRGGENRQQIWRLNVSDGRIENLSQNEFEDWDPVWVK